MAGEILSLPVFPDLTDAEVERVVTAIESFVCAAPRSRGRHAGENARIPD
jgi:hypothetical protein